MMFSTDEGTSVYERFRRFIPEWDQFEGRIFYRIEDELKHIQLLENSLKIMTPAERRDLEKSIQYAVDKIDTYLETLSVYREVEGSKNLK